MSLLVQAIKAQRQLKLWSQRHRQILGLAIFLTSTLLIIAVFFYEIGGQLVKEQPPLPAPNPEDIPNIPDILNPAYLSQPGRVKKIAFIGALFGDYEKTIKEPVLQSMGDLELVDFFMFSDRDENSLKSDAHGNFSAGQTTQWKLVNTPYHDMLFKETADGLDSFGRNSFLRNRHPFNYAKFYKVMFHHVGFLSDYDVIIWMDATTKVKSKWMAREVAYLIDHGKNIVLFRHDPVRAGLMFREVIASQFDKYLAKEWLGIAQPSQDTLTQYRDYLRSGFQEYWWMEFPKYQNLRESVGMWVTNVIAWDMRESGKRKQTLDFLSLWWEHLLLHTTQDQVSFPFVCWKQQIMPYTLEDEHIKGTADSNAWFDKLPHGL